MNPEYLKTKQVRLCDIGKDEKWLHKMICSDPSILGLGNLSVIERERPQPPGGRIDLVLKDREEGIQYTVEVMLGAVDESHIIRTIEYWDIERRRNRTCEHKAVIVAEEITRFFNVIRLLSDSIPIIAIQLNSLIADSKLCLDFVKVLNVTEEIGDEPSELVTRTDWENWASPQSLEIMDKMVSLIPREDGKADVKYNEGYTAVSTSGTQFCWFHPRKGPRLHVVIWIGKERDSLLDTLIKQGIEATPHPDGESVKFVLTNEDFEQHKSVLQKLLAIAEQGSSG